MILDAQNQYSSAQALTTTGASTNIIDHGADRNLGIGEPLAVVINVEVALAGTTPTFKATLQTDDAEAFPSAATVIESKEFSSLAKGDKIVLPIPPNTDVERFTRLNYTLGGTSPTITVSAHLVPQKFIQNDVHYADAITIS